MVLLGISWLTTNLAKAIRNCITLIYKPVYVITTGMKHLSREVTIKLHVDQADACDYKLEIYQSAYN